VSEKPEGLVLDFFVWSFVTFTTRSHTTNPKSETYKW